MRLFQKARKLFKPIQLNWQVYRDESKHNGRQLYPLDTFENDNDQYKLNLVNDNTIGGISKGAVLYSEEEKAGIYGYLVSHLCWTQLETLPYVGMEYYFPKSLTLTPFKSLRLKLRTDGSIFKINLLVTSNFDFGSHLAHAFIVDKNQQWETYELPFSKFKMMGYDKEETSLGNHDTELVIHSLQILKEGQKNEKFALQLKEIVLNKDCFANISDQPIFYKISSLKEGKLNTGKEEYNSILLEKGISKKSINNLY